MIYVCVVLRFLALVHACSMCVVLRILALVHACSTCVWCCVPLRLCMHVRRVCGVASPCACACMFDMYVVLRFLALVRVCTDILDRRLGPQRGKNGSRFCSTKRQRHP